MCPLSWMLVHAVKFHSQFHSRWYSLRITLKYTTLVGMRSGYVWTSIDDSGAEVTNGSNSVLHFCIQIGISINFFCIPWMYFNTKALHVALHNCHYILRLFNFWEKHFLVFVCPHRKSTLKVCHSLTCTSCKLFLRLFLFLYPIPGNSRDLCEDKKLWCVIRWSTDSTNDPLNSSAVVDKCFVDKIGDKTAILRKYDMSTKILFSRRNSVLFWKREDTYKKQNIDKISLQKGLTVCEKRAVQWVQWHAWCSAHHYLPGQSRWCIV